VRPHRDAEAGRVVALDKTSALLSGMASTMLRFKTDQPLPPAVAPLARVTGRIVQLKAHDAPRWSRCWPRCARRREGRGPGDRPCRPGGRVPADHGRQPLMFAGAGTLFRKEVLRFWSVAFQTVAARS